MFSKCYTISKACKHVDKCGVLIGKLAHNFAIKEYMIPVDNIFFQDTMRNIIN